MAKRTVLVIGATGDVGQGIVRAVLSRGWKAIAAGRSRPRLEQAFAAQQGGGLHLVVGSLETEETTRLLWDAALAEAGQIDAVVVSVNAPQRLAPLEAWTAADFGAMLEANVVTHFNAAKILRPLLPDDGLYIGIGGGTADFIIPTNATVSVCQAGLRMMYRGFARERKGGAPLRELMIVSMVNGASKRDHAQPEWVTDDDVGVHVCAIIAAPDQFPGPILHLRSREQAGRPEPTEGITR